MMFYHVRISQKSSKSHDELKLGLDQNTLRRQFLAPYENGEPIVVNGKTIPLADISRLRISESTVPPEELVRRAEYKRRNSGVLMIGGPSDEWYAAELAKDVTDHWIKGPPGSKRKAKSKSRAKASATRKSSAVSKRIFVVHGHDHALKNDIEVFLREIGLEPIILHRQADEGQTVIEKFERYSDVAFVLILATPDDAASTVEEAKKAKKDRQLEARARQNVIFEWGFFVGKLGRKQVCCVYKEGVTLPSDLAGLLYVKVRESVEEIGYKLIKEMKAAGLSVSLKYE